MKARHARPAGRRRRDERGVALVEFALLLPLIAVLIFGVVDLGRAYQLQNRLHNAAREGARFAQYAPEQVDTGASCAAPYYTTWAANHEQGANSYTVVVQKLVSGTWTDITGCKTPQDPTRTVNAGDRIRVRVSAPFTVLTPLLSSMVSNPVTVTGSEEIVVQG